MSSKNIFTVILSVVISTTTIYSQGLKRKMADQYFNMMEYYRAAPIYDELATSSVKKSSNDDVLIRRAAQSFSSISDYQKSAFWYSKLVDISKATDDDILAFIRVLLYNKNYDKAREFITNSGSKFDHYPIFSEYKNDLSIITELMEDSDEIKISDVPCNSGFGEFAPSYYEGDLIFVSKKWSSGFANRKYGWDGENYVNLYIALVDHNDHVSKKVKPFHKTFMSKFHNGPITFNSTFDFTVFTRNDLDKDVNNSLGRLMLFTSQRDAKGKWSKPVPFPYNSKDYSVGHPSLSPDGKTLYFTSDMPGGFGSTDIWKSTWDGTTWTTPENLGPKINTPGKEMFPYMHTHGHLYFSSDGHVGLGGLDLFVVYDIGTSPFIKNLGYPANTNMDDFGIVLDENGERGFFSSNRIKSSKKRDQIITDNIYAIKLAIPEFKIIGVVINNDTKEKMANSLVLITNNKSGVVDSIITNEEGGFTKELKPHTGYTIVAGKEKFELLNTENVSTVGIRVSKNFDVELKLTSMYVNFIGTVIDSKTKQPITNATFILKETLSNEEKTFTTDEKGQIKTEIRKNQEFGIHASAHDYLSQNETLSTSNITTSTTIEKTIPLTLFAKKGDVVKLEHIYYDLGKWDLRDEGKLELNKLADYLLENPAVKIELSSHTDSRNSSSSNQKLSQKRAQSCVDYLVSKGISKDRMTAKGYGETRLVNYCKDGVDCTEEEHQQNRRTEVKIIAD